MTEPDIIRIDGVDHLYVTGVVPWAAPPDHLVVAIRPKRKQTGWICRGCSRTAPCVEITTHPDPPTGCTRPIDITPRTQSWARFYGKVVDE